jgi:hypothetical protein
MVNLLNRIYTVKLIKLQNDRFHNYFNFLKPKKIKNIVNLKNYRNLYIRYLSNKFKYKKNELILENLINNTINGNFLTADFLFSSKSLIHKPIIFDNFKKLKK